MLLRHDRVYRNITGACYYNPIKLLSIIFVLKQIWKKLFALLCINSVCVPCISYYDNITFLITSWFCENHDNIIKMNDILNIISWIVLFTFTALWYEANKSTRRDYGVVKANKYFRPHTMGLIILECKEKMLNAILYKHNLKICVFCRSKPIKRNGNQCLL